MLDQPKTLATESRAYLIVLDGSVVGVVDPSYDPGTGRDTWVATIGVVNLDSGDWLAAPLVERVARRNGSTRKAAIQNALAAWEAGT